MIVSIIAPKGGVGSSTLAVLLARSRAVTGKVLLVDAAGDRSLDLYTNTAHLLSGSYAGSIAESAVATRDLPDLEVLRAEPGDGPLGRALSDELRSLTDTDVIVDHGSPGPGWLKGRFLGDLCLVVLTQDNQVLRAADRLLGELRQEGREASFAVNMLEDLDTAQLGGLEEIYDLFEEDHLGSISFQHEIRLVINTGFSGTLPERTREEADEMAEKIFGQVESAPSLDAKAASASEPTMVPEGSPAAAQGSRSVLEGIRSFFRSFRKG